MNIIDEHLAEQASLYAAGALTAQERDLFELILEFHGGLQTHVRQLLEVAAAATLATQPHKQAGGPSPALKARIIAAVQRRAQEEEAGIVVTGPDRLVRWVNDVFTDLCGYTLEELEGKSLGPILQGEKTDRATVERLRNAVRERRACQETILNYHRDGHPYWVEIRITPIHGAGGDVRWLVAREREVAEPAVK